MNIGDAWKSREEIFSRLTDRVMETRPGLDRKRVEAMVLAFWEADN